MKMRPFELVLPLVLALPASAHCQPRTPATPTPHAIADAALPGPARMKWSPVSGTGIHYFSSATVHSAVPTEDGIIQRSTETVDLDGDLVGRLLYQPISVFNFAAGTLVNTGHQVFSGTVLGSPPVLLHDDTFRFEVDLATGATLGIVHLDRRIAGPDTRCFPGQGAIPLRSWPGATYSRGCSA